MNLSGLNHKYKKCFGIYLQESLIVHKQNKYKTIKFKT